MEDAQLNSKQQSINTLPFTYPNQAIFSTTAELTSQIHFQCSSTLTNTSVFTASMRTTEEVLDDFLKESLAFDEDFSPSQLVDAESQTPSQIVSRWQDEKVPVARPKSSKQLQASSAFPMPCPHLRDLKEIPSASFLQSIGPQTATLDLIIGIMTLSPPRQVTVGRRWGREREMQLLEMLVGDETRAGFKITMWLSNSSQMTDRRRQRSTLELQMQRLRPRDIVLIRNVALRSYQGRVHGQILRSDVTKVELLYRGERNGSDSGGMYCSKALSERPGTDVMLKKAQRVRHWLIDYVADDYRENYCDTVLPAKALPPESQ